MTDTIYRYIKVPTKKGNGYICLRVDRPAKDATDFVYRVSVAFCSPKDAFNRSIARSIMDSRMKDVRRLGLVTTLKYEKKPHFNRVCVDAMDAFTLHYGLVRSVESCAVCDFPSTIVTPPQWVWQHGSEWWNIRKEMLDLTAPRARAALTAARVAAEAARAGSIPGPRKD